MSSLSMDITINDINKLDIFTNLFQNIKLFTGSINIHCNKERMYIQTMDTSKISIVDIMIPKEWFCSYHCDSPIVIGISTLIFYKLLSSRDKSQTMQLIYDIEEKDKLFVHMKSVKKTVFDRDFEAPLIDLDSELLSVPIIEYEADIILPSLDFALLINQLRGFGETLQFVCNENHIEMISKSIDSGKMSVSVEISNLSSFEIEEEKELNMSFSLSPLHNICQFCKIFPEVDIKLHSEYPLYIRFKHEQLSICFFLAPRIVEE